MAFVIDASAALAWLVPSQATTASETFRNAAARTDLLAPDAFRLEMRHALVKLERRGLVGPGALDAHLPALESLLTLAPPLGTTDLAGAVALAREERLGLYDALYVQLATARGATLASRDSVLLEAAQRRGAAVEDLR
jgi:predicted nucleic acid-binding protein